MVWAVQPWLPHIVEAENLVATETIPRLSQQPQSVLQRSWSLPHAGRLKRLGSDDSGSKMPQGRGTCQQDMKASRQRGKSFSFPDLFLSELPAEATAHRYDGAFHLN